MHPTAKNELKIAIKVYYNRYTHKKKAIHLVSSKIKGSASPASLNGWQKSSLTVTLRFMHLVHLVNQNTIAKMFDNLPEKIRSANVNGLNSVL